MTKALDTNVEDFNPTQNFLLVHPVNLERGEVITETGLIMAQEQNTSIIDRPTTGAVIAVGPDCTLKTEWEVFWPQTDGIEMQFKNGDFILFKEESIIGYKIP